MAKFLPQEGAFLNCQLPGELVRSIVDQVVSDDLAIVKLSVATPISKVHTYKLGDLVPVRRVARPLGEVWEAVSMAELNAAAEEEKAREEVASQAKPKRRKTAAQAPE